MATVSIYRSHGLYDVIGILVNTRLWIYYMKCFLLRIYLVHNKNLQDRTHIYLWLYKYNINMTITKLFN